MTSTVKPLKFNHPPACPPEGIMQEHNTYLSLLAGIISSALEFREQQMVIDVINLSHSPIGCSVLLQTSREMVARHSLLLELEPDMKQFACFKSLDFNIAVRKTIHGNVLIQGEETQFFVTAC